MSSERTNGKRVIYEDFGQKIWIILIIFITLRSNYKYKHVRTMTALAQRIKETPMAPYMALLRGMTREQKQIVLTFIAESMEEPSPKRQVPKEFKRLRGMVNITKEEMAQDEHLAHIMER